MLELLYTITFSLITVDNFFNYRLSMHIRGDLGSQNQFFVATLSHNVGEQEHIQPYTHWKNDMKMIFLFIVNMILMFNFIHSLR